MSAATLLPTNNAPPRKLPLNAVNGWRGPGAIAISIGHYAAATHLFSLRSLAPLVLLVDFFFVLSGILIAQVYSEKLRRASAIPEYIMRRLGRIWPVQAATVLALVLYELMKLLLETYANKHFSSPPFSPDGLNPVSAIFTNLLLIQSLGLHHRETWNFPSWSVSVEFTTYAIFAMFCLVPPRPRRALVVATVAACLAILVLIAPYHMSSTYDFGIFRCLAGFLVGTLCYDILRQSQPPAWKVPSLVEIGVFALVCLWLYASVGTYLTFLAPFVFGLFVVTFTEERGVLSRLLMTKPFQILAELSFSIYMVHALVLIFMLGLLHEYERRTGVHLFLVMTDPLPDHPGAMGTAEALHIDSIAAKLGLGVFYLAAVLVASYGMFRFVEVPGRVYFSALGKRVSKAPARGDAQARGNSEPMEPAQ